MSEMKEEYLDKILEKLNMSDYLRGWIDEIRGKLKMRGIVLVASADSVPVCFGVDYTDHDKEIEKKYAEQYEETIKELRQNNNLLRCKNEELEAKNTALTEKVKAYEEHYVKTSELIRGYDREILELKAQCQNLTQNERLAYKKNNGNEAARYEEENKKLKEEMAAYENIFYNILQDKCLGEAAEFLPRHLWDKIKIIPQWWLPDELENNETAKEYETHLRDIRHLILDYLHGQAEAQVPDTPIKIADWLIDKYFNTDCLSSEIIEKSKDCLRQIAEHLLVFCGRE